MWVLKVGGRQLDDGEFVAGLAQLLQRFPSPPVVVHGGGRGTTELSARLGLTSRFVDGLRVTDEATLEAAVMGLAGLAKIQLVRGLVARGVRALGLTGADAGLVRCRKLEHDQDLGWVGHPARVDGDGIRRLVEGGWVVCLSPLCLDEEGRLYNVNADPVAAAVAAAVQAETLVFLTDVAGVLVEDRVLPELEPVRYRQLVADGAIGPGMVPKLQACFEALEQGVRQVLISNLEGVSAWLQGQPGGTMIRK